MDNSKSYEYAGRCFLRNCILICKPTNRKCQICNILLLVDGNENGHFLCSIFLTVRYIEKKKLHVNSETRAGVYLTKKRFLQNEYIRFMRLYIYIFYIVYMFQQKVEGKYEFNITAPSRCFIYKCSLKKYNYVTYHGNRIDLEWAVGINRFTLEMIGLWPDEKLSSRQKFLANVRAFVIFTTLLTVSIVPSIFSLIRVWSDMISIIDNLQITLPISATAMKIIIMWLRKEGRE